jgi:repressor LexA
VALTKKRKAVLEFVQGYIRANGYAPTLREIGANFGLSSVATVHKYLQSLVNEGLLVREGGGARAVGMPAPRRPPGAEVPLLGLIAAGTPIEALPNADSVSLPESLLGRGETFVLKVRGNSMIEDHIVDGDLIIVERRDRAENGEIAVALIENEATVKRFYREPEGRIRLQPANSALQPLYYSEDAVRIQGVVIGILRKMRR